MKRIIPGLVMLMFYLAAFSNAPVIVSSGYTFSPASVTINVGDSVVFQLANIHDVVEVSQTTWNADGNAPLSGGFSLPFGGGTLLPAQLPVGVHYFVCSPHAHLGMKGTITVTQSNGPSVTFQTLYGLANDTSDSWAANIIQTADGGYITAGYVSNFGAGGDEVSFIKLTATGDTSWVKVYGVPQNLSDDDVTQFIQTSDGGYALAGLTQNFNGQDAFLIKTDATGNLSWTKIYGSGDSTSNALVNSLVQTTDSGFVMTGYISNYGAGNTDVYFLKTDASGKVVWTKTYGGSNTDVGSSVAPTSDGGYIITGTTSSFADTLGDVYLIKTDANGDTLWTWTYGSNLTDAMDMGNSVKQTTDNGYIITGVTMSASQGSYALLIKTDSNGVMQWGKLYGTGTSASSASAAAGIQTTDGGYAFTGYTGNFGGGGEDYYLVKTDASGDTIFTRTFGGPNTDYASGLTQTTDGGFMIAGWTSGFQYNAVNGGFAYYVKTDANGHTGACNEYNTGTTINSSITFYALRTATQVSSGGVDSSVSFITTDGGTMLGLCGTATGINEVNASNTDVLIYPVPFSNEATVKISSSEQLHDCAFVMFNAVGQQVTRTNVPDGLQFNIEGRTLAGGFYFYQLVTGSQVLYTGKLTIVH